MILETDRLFLRAISFGASTGIWDMPHYRYVVKR